MFSEKRDVFLEGQGLFTFGGVGGGSPPLPGTTPSSGSTDAPTIFYSRRIGLESGRAVPIIGGGRLSGRAGKWTIGALNTASDNDSVVNFARTDFTVLRVRRDILRRSAVGALFTQRSISTRVRHCDDLLSANRVREALRIETVERAGAASPCG